MAAHASGAEATMMAAHVSLPMYGPGLCDWAREALWLQLRERLLLAPAALSHCTEDALLPAVLTTPCDRVATWLSPQLVMSQTCGGPLVVSLYGRVSVVGTPCYDTDGCAGPDYCSLLIAHRQCEFLRRDGGDESLASFRAARAAINSVDSLSGYIALLAAAAAVLDSTPAESSSSTRDFFSTVIATGGHQASVEYVADGRADVAAIDCVTFGLIRIHRPDLLEDIVVWGRTPHLPGLPIITALDSPHLTGLQDAWAATAADDAEPCRGARKALLIAGFDCSRGEDTLQMYTSRVSAAMGSAASITGRLEDPFFTALDQGNYRLSTLDNGAVALRIMGTCGSIEGCCWSGRSIIKRRGPASRRR